MKAIITKDIPPGTWYFQLLVFDINPERCFKGFNTEKLIDFGCYLDCEQEIMGAFKVLTDRYLVSKKIYADLFAASVIFTDTQCNLINELYFKMLDNNYIEGCCYL